MSSYTFDALLRAFSALDTFAEGSEKSRKLEVLLGKETDLKLAEGDAVIHEHLAGEYHQFLARAPEDDIHRFAEFLINRQLERGKAEPMPVKQLAWFLLDRQKELRKEIDEQ